MTILKTIEITFQGKKYKIRRNFLTLKIWQEELAKLEDRTDMLATITFAYAALKGYNDFSESLNYVMMHIDDESNANVLTAITELFPEVTPEKEDTEKK